MNLKDRLDIIKNTNNLSIKQDMSVDNCLEAKNFFENSAIVREIINYCIYNGKNILFLADKSIDKDILSYSIKSLLESQNIELYNSVSKNVDSLHSGIKVIPSKSIGDVVKILEYIMYGYNSFIFSLDILFDDNFLEKLKTIIALNYRNFTEENIKTLIGYSNLIVIPLYRNDDGLFVISEIREISYIDDKLVLTVYENSNLKNVDIISKNIDLNEENSSVDAQNVKNEIIEVNQTSVENIDIISEEMNYVEDLSASHIDLLNESDESAMETEGFSSCKDDKSIKKINKYKLLREKIKSKRNE